MRIEERVTIDAPPDRVWERVSDTANYRGLMRGITRWESQGEVEGGLGARYLMRMRVGSVEVGSLIEVVEFDEPREMAWTSVTGLDQRGRWRLRAREGGRRTDVTLRLSYQAPGGLLATLADRASAPLVRTNIRGSLDSLKHAVEGGAQGPAGDGRNPVRLLLDGMHAVRVLAGAGLVRPEPPNRVVRSLLDLARWGPTPAAAYAASAERFPREIAIIDEIGALTFEEVHRRTNALAHALSDAGILEGDGLAIMCRNHRGFVDATVAASKLGANALFLNTAFAGPQLTEVLKREKPKAVIYDQEFAGLIEEGAKRRKRFVAWVEDQGAADDPTLEGLIASGDPSDAVPPQDPGKVVILTSGTTGAPKGASRGQPGVGAAVSILSRIPLRARQRVHVAAPLFHAWGIAHFQLGMLLSSTLVLRRKFDPEQTLATIEREAVECCPMVPVMLQRILALPEEVRRGYDTSSLQTVPVSGSALPGHLAHEFMDQFGDVLYNLYGSTEVAWAAIATPEDLREAPGTSGLPPRGTTLRIVGEDGGELPRGQTGKIYVGNEMLFEGYTGGGTEELVDGLMATGDLGRFDERGRLFVEGRADEMIVSGGENVYPQEVEDLLARHDRIEEAAVVGVDDEDWGQRLEAFVVSKGKLSKKEVLSYVKENLARYKVPRRVEFLDELPRNQTGKVLKRELAERS